MIRKISSRFLLLLYLLVVAHQSIAHTHSTSEIDGDASTRKSHQHEDFNSVHHDHHFHVGIFHFLGHLFETISHAGDVTDDHLVLLLPPPVKKITGIGQSFNDNLIFKNVILVEVDAESIPDPPEYLISYFEKLKYSTSPLRGPPSFV